MAIATGTALAIGAIASGGASAYGAKKQASSANRAAALQTQSSNEAARLQSEATQKALDFQIATEAQRARELADTQAKNFAIYQEETGYSRGRDALADERFNTREQNLTPYRRTGVASLGQLMKPIAYTQAPRGTLAALMKR